MNIEVSFIRLESKVNEYPNAPGCGLVAKYSARWQHSQYHLAAAGGCAARVQCLNLFSVQPVGTLCLCGEKDAGEHTPQRQRVLRGCTEELRTHPRYREVVLTALPELVLTALLRASHQISTKLATGPTRNNAKIGA